MKKKKISAVLFCVALLMSILPFGGVVLSAAAEATDAVAYVSTAATGSGTIGDENDPFPSLSAAIKALDAVSTDGERVAKIMDATYKPINVAGDLNADDGDYAAFSSHENLITVVGNDGTNNTIDLTKVFSIGGPLTLDNITYTTNSNGHTNAFFLGGHEMTFGAGSKSEGSKIYIYAGIHYDVNMLNADGETVSSRGTAHKITMLGENHNISRFYAYSRANATDIVYPGTTLVLDSVKFGYLYLGAHNATATLSTSYNIELLGNSSFGTVTNNLVRTRFSDGTALQVILNNGVTNTKLPRTFSDANGDKTAYVLSCAAGGSTLHATDVAGTYTIADPAWQATATNGTNTYTSQNGVLTVGAAGEYTVTWTEAPEEEEPIEMGSTVYVDYANGDDATTSGAEDAPFKTLTAAMEALDALETTDERTVVLLSNYAIAANDANKLPDHNNLITIKGKEGSEILDLLATFSTGGPLTLDNLQYTFDTTSNTGSLSYGGFPLTIGENATFVKGPSTNGNASGRLYASYGKDNTTMASGKPYALTINNGKFFGVYFMGYNAGLTIPGMNFVINGGNITQAIYVGALSGYVTTYTDNVNLEINGGTIKAIQSVNYVGRSKFADGAALQIILNNNMAASVPQNITAEAVEGVGGKLYVLNCAEDVYLHATETAGAYTVDVPDGMYAVAKKDGALVAIAADGETLSLSAAGTYEIAYTNNAVYTIAEAADGTVTLTVNMDYTVNFADLAVVEKDGYIFNGWVNADGGAVTTTALTAGTVLTAQYVAKENHFYMVGTQIREASGNKKQALRFIVHLGKDFGVDVTEKGSVILPNNILSTKELVLNGSYTYGTGVSYSSQRVVGEKLWVDADSYVRYTAALTGITDYMTAYAVRGYIKYTDLNGVARVAYTDKTPAASLNEVAEMLLEQDAGDAMAKSITQAAKAAIEAKYADTTAPLNSSLFNSPNTGYTKLHADIEDDGRYVTSDDTAIDFYKLNGQLSTLVTEITIDAVGENSNIDPTTIVQLSDIHFTYCDDVDFAENNVYTMNSWEKRQGNGTFFTTANSFKNYRMQYILNALEYAAAVGDQIVTSGDMIDFISHGNLTLMNRVIAEPYSNALMMVGNHEPVRLVSETSSLSDPNKWSEEYYAILKKYWNDHDLSYTSKMVGKEVMVIQMDNSHYFFTQSQVDKLTADLVTARENGYTVLIFTHIPFEPTDGCNSQELLMGSGGFADTSYNSETDTNKTLIDALNPTTNSSQPEEYHATTTAVYNLIVDNGDIVRGVFNGHKHNTVYSRLYKEGGTVVPQYTLAAAFIDGGVVMKVNVTDKDADLPNRVLYSDDKNVIRVDDATGITVRETTLDLGLGEENALEIVQINDAHLTATNEKRKENFEAALDFATDSDYLVVNGDMIDSMNASAYRYFVDTLEPFKNNSLWVVGNHEWHPSETPTEEDYAWIQQYWQNDVNYSSVVVQNKVMLIQMDNSQGKFLAGQAEKLQADLTTARAQGYKVLLFVHEPLNTNNAKNTSVKAIYSVDNTEWATTTHNFNTKSMTVNSSNENNVAVAQVITTNGDLIRGVFAGHLHSDFYVEITATDADGNAANIPQYVNGAAKFADGQALKITLK